MSFIALTVLLIETKETTETVKKIYRLTEPNIEYYK
jgi:hypothetical protein